MTGFRNCLVPHGLFTLNHFNGNVLEINNNAFGLVSPPVLVQLVNIEGLPLVGIDIDDVDVCDDKVTGVFFTNVNNFHPIHQLANMRADLSSAPYFLLLVPQWNEFEILALELVCFVQPQPHRIQPEQLAAPFTHQRPCHDFVVFEVAREIPIRGTQNLFTQDCSQPMRTPVGNQVGDPVNHQDFFRRKRQPQAFVIVSHDGLVVALAEIFHVGLAERCLVANVLVELANVLFDSCGACLAFSYRPHDAFACRQVFFGEKPSTSVPHLNDAFPVHVTIVGEKHQHDVALLGIRIDSNVIHQGVALFARAEEFQGRVEQSIGPVAFADEIDAHVRNQQQVALSGLDRDAPRHVAAAAEPGILFQIKLRRNGARLEILKVVVDFCRQFRDSRDQQVVLHGQQHPVLVRINDGKFVAKHLPNLALGKFKQILVVKNDLLARMVGFVRLDGGGG